MVNVTLLTGGNVPKVSKSPMKERRVIRTIDIVRKENSMTDKRIKSYLEDRLKRLESIRNKRKWTTAELGDAVCCKKTLAFIDSLQEEPVSEDLEEAARSYSNNLDNICGSVGEQTRNAFKAGAKWQKEQMMAKTVDGYVIEDVGNGNFVLSANYLPKSMGLKDNQDVKVIVIKAD